MDDTHSLVTLLLLKHFKNNKYFKKFSGSIFLYYPVGATLFAQHLCPLDGARLDPFQNSSLSLTVPHLERPPMTTHS